MKTYGNDRAKTFGISSSLIDAVRKVTSGQPIEEETPEEESKPEQLEESMSIHVTPHTNGTHHVVKKVGSKMKKHGGVKVGEKLSDTEVDDARDSGIKVHHENKQYDLPGKPKKLKDTPVEKAKKMHLAATPGQEKAVTEENPLIAAASDFLQQESGMGRVAYQKQSGEPGTGLETFVKKKDAKLPKDQALTKNLDGWRLKGKVKRKGVSRDKRLGKEEVEFDEADSQLPRQMKDPKTETMVAHKKHGTKVIDKKDEDKHLKKGWVRAESVDHIELDETMQDDMQQLSGQDFQAKYGQSKAVIRKRTSGVTAVGAAHKVRREAVEHACANHVKSEQWGDGTCIPGMHTLEVISEDDDEGIVTHYDVMFEHGIEEDVPVEDLEIISEKHHGHKRMKRSVKKEALDPVDALELKGKHKDRKDKDIDNDGDVDDSDKYLHRRRKKVKKSMKEWANDAIVGKMIENPSRSAADAYQLATHYYNLSKGIDEELLDKAATLYGTFLEMDPGLNPVFRFESMDKILEARKGGGAAVGETERSGHRVTKTEKEGPEHIAMQLRKVGSLKGQHGGVDFNDGSKVKIDHKHAAAALDRYNNSKPADKEEMQRHMAHSHDALKHVASGKPLHSSPAAQKKSSNVGFKSSARLEPTRDLVHPAQDKRPK